MNKKRTLILGIILIVCLGLGGKIYMDNRAEQKQKELISVERMAVLALKKTFENIKSVTFKENQGRNNMSGSYRFILTVINNKEESCTFDIIYVKGEKNLENYGIENRDVQKKGNTLVPIQVIYSNKEKEKI